MTSPRDSNPGSGFMLRSPVALSVWLEGVAEAG